MDEGARLRLKLDGPEVTLSDVRSALDALADLVRDVSESLAGRRDVVRWVVRDASAGSFAIELAGESFGDNVPPTTAREVTRSVVTGLASLQLSAQRPRHFSDSAMRNARALGVLANGHAILVDSGALGSASVTSKVLAHVDEVIGPRFESYGTVEGVLEGISVHGKRRFEIYDLLTGHKVECFFADRIPLDEVLGAFTKRVSARGILRTRQTGERLSIEVREFSVFPDDRELPDAERVRGLLK